MPTITLHVLATPAIKPLMLEKELRFSQAEHIIEDVIAVLIVQLLQLQRSAPQRQHIHIHRCLHGVSS